MKQYLPLLILPDKIGLLILSPPNPSAPKSPPCGAYHHTTPLGGADFSNIFAESRCCPIKVAIVCLEVSRGPFPPKGNVTDLASVRIIDQAGGRSRKAKNLTLAFSLVQKNRAEQVHIHCRVHGVVIYRNHIMTAFMSTTLTPS